MNTSFPSSNARWRTGHCGESGFAFRVRAAAHSGVRRNRSAAASAPVKLGMRPRAPGNRAAPSAASRSHTSSRRPALAASTSGLPPASRS